MVLGDKNMGRDMENLAKWRKANLRRLTFELNKENDKDIIDHLEKQPNKREYLIGLIRKDMQETGS